MTVELKEVSKRSKVIHELYTNPIHLWNPCSNYLFHQTDHDFDSGKQIGERPY